MKTFPHWRAAGRVMLDARRRGIKRTRHREPLALDHVATTLEWRRPDGHSVLVSLMSHCELFDVRAGGPVKDCYMSDWDDAGEVLRILAALDLIPAHLAEGPDERYGRCATCGRVARWWSYLGQPRWVHIQPWAVTGPAPHRAEVAG